MPFGLGIDVSDDKWDDALLTESELSTVFNVFNLIFNDKPHWGAFMIHWRDGDRMFNQMTRAGFKNIQFIHVYKPEQNMKGTHQLLNAVEVIICGWKPNRAVVRMHFSDEEVNPMFRHNIMYVPGVTKKFVDQQTGEEVNPTEKHPVMAHRLAQLFCAPAEAVLVVGAGSGSDCLGFLRGGCDVIAIEKSVRQFKQLPRRIMAEKVDEKKAMEESNHYLNCQKLARNALCKFSKLEEVIIKVKAKTDKKKGRKRTAEEMEAQQEAVPAPSSSKSAKKPQSEQQEEEPVGLVPEKYCVGCDKKFLEGEGLECGSETCKSILHKDCHESVCQARGRITKVAGDGAQCNLLFCDADCEKDHACSANAPTSPQL